MPAVTAAPPGGKVNLHGIEVVSGLTWQGWEPGREYTKNVILKNVKVKTQKLKYKVPESRFFTTLYPQPIVLSAGTSFTLPVTFRPLEKNIYEDKIEFLANDGTFQIPIRAVLPEVRIEVPENIQFNMCSAKDQVQLQFEIKNSSELTTPFQIDCPEPFMVEPRDGVLEPFGSFSIIATFKPQGALVYIAEAVVKYGPEFTHNKRVKMEGIGKYPHLLVSSGGQAASRHSGHGNLEAVVNFGDVSVGQTAEKWIELQNLSPVNAPFTVEHPTGLGRIDTVFTCLQKTGIVPSLSAVRIPIVYTPNTVDTKSIDYFHVVAIGNISKTVIKCLAESKGPQVSLSKSAINFLQVDAGRSATKTVDFINDSDTEADYQFLIDCSESVFKLEATSGVLPPKSKTTLIFKFQPVKPINYYKRLQCVIHNQSPLFLDLVGTCHTETSKPAVLQTKHIESYRTHVQRGLSLTPPEQLNELVKQGKLKIEEGTLKHAQGDGESGCAGGSLQPMDEYFNDGYHSETTTMQPHVSMDIHQADFGQCSDIRLIPQMTANLTNHTNGKVTMVWMGGPDHVFSVSPPEMDIPPKGAAVFTVKFKPNAPNQFYGAELEGYCYYKSMRDYRLTEDVTHCPPWCVTITATGHTFQPHNETFLPRYLFDSSKLVFPAVNTHEATYRTLLLTNTGTTPILFDFEKDDTGIFSVKPTKGLLVRGQQIFTVRILPTAVQTYKRVMHLRLNEADKNTQEVTMYGSAEAAQVVLENEGELFFKPTCVGMGSTRQYAVKNVSRIPLRFEWKTKHADGLVLSVEPSEGVIQPNEKQYHAWTFVPREETKYVLKPSLLVWGQGLSPVSSAGKKKLFAVRAIGEGSLGTIAAEQSYVDFGTVVVGTSSTRHVVLSNESPCSLYYQLSVEQNVTGPYQDEQSSEQDLALELDSYGGVLPARSKQIITATVRPHRRVYYQFNITYTLHPPRDGSLVATVQEPTHLCHILATGVYPSIAVTDARCYGSAINISKKQLWNLFSLDNLNVCLDSDPSPTEVMYSAATRHSHQRRPPVYTRAIMDFNFGSAPVGSEPCVVQLMLENTGTSATEWGFLFPHELHLELEYWAETGEFTSDELHEMKVMDNKLFLVEPSRGSLQPGECQNVTFIYHHQMAGTDRLPVLLKLAQGREILLNFIGVTVEPDCRYIHFPSNKHMFAPVPIGEKTSPKQIYELYNGGALPVKYEFDVLPLELVKQENFSHAVFTLHNPMGEILPGHTAAVNWTFAPLEAKTYMVDVPIRIHNGDTAVITFTGVGYDKRALGDTMPLTDQTSLSGVPAVQSVSGPGQLCFLSQERLSFGNMPLFSKARRLVTVTNKSSKHPVSYQWHVTQQRDAQFVSIFPPSGLLEPGESHIAKVTFIARGQPSFYDLDLVCEITNQTEYRSFMKQLLAWQAERERGTVEFTITEDDLQADMRELDTEVRPPSGKLKALGGRTPSPEDFAKYRTLPPIRQQSIDKQREKEKEIRKLRKDYWEKPVAPKPFLLHLGVTSRTHDISDFQINFPQDYKNFFIDRSLSEAVPETARGRAEDEQTSCLEVEADIVAGALASIVRGLLDDSSFLEACNTLAEEPTPFFQQFSTRPTPEPTPHAMPSVVLHESSFTPTQMGGPADDNMLTDVHPDEMADEPLEQFTQEQAEETGEDGAKLTSPAASRGSAQSVASRHKSATPEQDTHVQVGGADILVLGDTQDPSIPPSPQQQTPDFHGLQELKKTAEFGSVLESLVENSITNILQEAFHQEFNITARPRLVALPPRPSSNSKT